MVLVEVEVDAVGTVDVVESEEMLGQGGGCGTRMIDITK